MAQGIEGLDKLMKKYGQLAETVAEQSMEKAVGRAIKMIQGEAKLLCPTHDGELRDGIKTKTERLDDRVIGSVYINKKYAQFVELGTGPKGQADHSGISPALTPAYSQSPWWIHESQIDADIAEEYHWFCIDTPDGRFYQCSGQAAQPFMYPALKNNEERVTRNVSNYIAREIRKVAEQ